MTPERAVLLSIAICVVAAAAALALARACRVAGAVMLGGTVASALLVGWAVASTWAGGGSPAPAALWPGAWPVQAPRFHVDGLSALFLALAAAIAVPAAVYSLGYVRARYADEPARRVGAYHALLLLFLAAMYGLVSTTDMMWFFFVFWQLMTLPGYALIRFERRPECARAADRYLLMMQIACAATMVGAELLVPAAAPGGPRYDLEPVSAALPALLAARPLTVAAAFGLFLVGFGIKMGMWPFGQVWLPDAHPAAPSPVSALLSGVMIKTGVYGLVRYFLWLPPAAAAGFPLARWGALVAILGTVTLLTGTAQALRQESSKRLLAFHSIGQIGYVLLGAGTCMALLPAGGGAAAVAALALCGALFHVVNHGLFKSLLFLDAGSMLCATGTLDLNRMGGLARTMPVTAATALVASLAISGAPLLNGFASKWALYAAALQGGAYARWLPLCAVIAILTSALTLASFLKFFGAGFLSRATADVRARAARGPLEVGWSMRGPQVALAAACVALGLWPSAAFEVLRRTLAASPGGAGQALARAAPAAGGAWSGLDPLGGAALLAPLALAALLLATALVALALSRLGGGARREAEPWLCGYARDADCYRYTAHGLYGELKRWLRWAGGAARGS